MSDRILERTAIRLDQFIAAINESAPDCCGIAELAVPWSHSPMRFSQAEIPHLIFETRNVLLASAMFASAAPRWCQPLPVGAEIAPLLQSTGSMHLLGLYSCSLMMMGYDYPAHPSLHTFGSGVMAHPKAPDHVRDDPELRCEFPAKELPGLCSRMVWFGEALPPQVRASLLPAAG